MVVHSLLRSFPSPRFFLPSLPNTSPELLQPDEDNPFEASLKKEEADKLTFALKVWPANILTSKPTSSENSRA